MSSFWGSVQLFILEGALKIAITADVHLTSIKQNPERYHALENVLDYLSKHQITELIIAGDLFDAKFQQYSEFDNLINKKTYQKINTLAIAGNHDVGVRNDFFTSDRIQIIDSPTILNKSEYGMDILLIPYERKRKISQVITDSNSNFKQGTWVLISHCDWLGGIREINQYEVGIYMPLTRQDIGIYKPRFVFLGHVHKKNFIENVYIPGSPCGLDITETGRRSFLILDTSTGYVEEQYIDTDIIYFDETLIALPADDESKFIDSQISNILSKINKTRDGKEICLRLRVKGYSSNIKKLKERITESFKPYRFYKDEEIDFSELKVSENIEKNYVAERVKEIIQSSNLESNIDEPTQEQILLSALDIIYKE